MGSLFAADSYKSGKRLFKRKGCVQCYAKDCMGKAKKGKIEKQKGTRIAGLDTEYINQQVNDIKLYVILKNNVS